MYKKIFTLRKTALFSLLCSLSSLGVAIEPRIFEVGYFDVVPTISFAASRNDNRFRADQNLQKSSAWVTSPSIAATLQNDSDIYSLQAGLTDGKDFDSEADNYTDWRLAASAQLEINSRNSLGFNASLFSTHEERGTGFSEISTLPDEPTKFEIQDFGLNYQFGAPAARGQIRVAATYNDVIYSDMELDAFARDRNSLGVSTTLAIRASPDVNFLLQYRYTETDFELDTIEVLGSRDSTENYAQLGWEWDINSSFTGSALVGYGERTYDSSLRGNESTPSWNIELLWLPLTYSSFTFSTNSTFSESAAIGSSVEGKTYSVNWAHEWSNRFSSQFSLERRNSSFGGTDREDTQTLPIMGFSYAYKRWLDFGISFRKEARESSTAALSYTQRVLSLQAEASF